jgi:hypothetical protein
MGAASLVKIIFDQELIITSGREGHCAASAGGRGCCCLYLIFSHLDGLQAVRVQDAGNAVLITARSRAAEAACHRRGPSSAQVSSWYRRRLHDLAAGGRPVTIDL